MPNLATALAFFAALVAAAYAGIALASKPKRPDPIRVAYERLMSGGADLTANHPFVRGRK